MHRRTILKASLATLPWLYIQSAQAAEAEVYVDEEKAAALSGWDAVSYFAKSGPIAGKPEHSTKWKGASWQFSSAENLELFKAAPEKYAPQFGGYCAYAAAKGSTAPGDPEAWTVHNDKLYINLSTSIRKLWLKDTEGNISKADANWPAILN